MPTDLPAIHEIMTTIGCATMANSIESRHTVRIMASRFFEASKVNRRASAACTAFIAAKESIRIN